MAQQQPRWRFAEMTPAQIAENPVQGEFFTSATDMPERLVREAIQNSMDAALPGQTVRVRFAFSGTDHSVPAERALPYLNGLTDHLDAIAETQISASSSGASSTASSQAVSEARAVYQASRLVDQPLEWLVVEDFGTRGLTGDTLANGASEPGNNFWGFFRQIGISTKGEDAAGSWGLGKWVFPDASQINAFLALTRRPSESESLLMGLAILKTHEKDGKRFPAYGHFAAPDVTIDSEWFQLPVSSGDSPLFVSEVANDFRLMRADHTGLSVIIPYPKKELTPASLARAVITQYFLPIMLGKLTVTIEHPEEEVRVIDAEHIEDELEWIDESDRDDESEESLRGMLHLARWGYKQDESDGHIRIDIPTNRYNPLRDEQADLDVEALRERYQRGERLAFELLTEARPIGQDTATKVRCRVYLQRSEELEHGHDYFVRGNLRIPKIDHLRSQKARSLLLVDGESTLGHLLRDAEGPAHTEWDPRAERVKENWAIGAGARIDEVRRAPVRLVQALAERPVERQLDALSDLFPSNISAPRAAASRKDSVITSNGPTPLPPRQLPSPVQLRQAAGGFLLLGNPNFPLAAAGTTWRVRFAYALARGSKKRAFSHFAQGVKDGCPDFSVRDGLNVNIHGCQARTTADNALEVSIEEEGFNLSVLGFDANRDVLVEVDLIADPAQPDGEVT